jgi:hypothetical protein
MNMLEFVTVKDNLLEFLRQNQDEVIDTSRINKNIKFSSQPNGVIDACIEEMEVDNVITFSKKDTTMAIAESGIRLLDEGGYSKRLIVEKKIIVKPVVSDTIYKKANRINKGNEITDSANLLRVFSMLSSILFKRV